MRLDASLASPFTIVVHMFCFTVFPGSSSRCFSDQLRFGAIRSATSFRRLSLALVLCLAAIPCAAQRPSSAKVQPQKTQQPQDPLQQHYDAAHTFYLGGDLDRAATEYNLFLAQAFHRLANAYSDARDFERSAKLFEEATNLAPDDNSLRLDAARTLFQQGKLQEARALVEKVRQSGQEDAKTQVLLGQILYAQRNYKDARAPLEAAVVAAPSFDVGYLLGATYIRLNDYTRARLLFSDMVQGLGESAQMHLLFARAYAKGDEQGLENAIAELKKAIAIDTTLPQVHYLLAVAYLTRDGEPAFSEMLPELRAELENRSDDANSHYLLGYIALKQHDTKTAEAEFRRSAAANPENPDLWAYLGQLHSDAGQDDEAETALRKAIAASSHATPDDFLIPRAHYMLGRVLLKKGQAEEGKRELEMSKELRDRLNGREQASEAEEDGKLTASAELKGDSSYTVADLSTPVSPELRKHADALNEDLKLMIADAYNNLGVMVAGQKQFETAVTDFEQAGEWNPSLATLDRNWGMAAFYANQYSRAIPPLARELAAHPNNARVRAILGLSYFGTENYPKVLETVRPVASELDDDPGLAYAYAVSLVKSGDDAEGIKRLQALTLKKTDSAEIHTLLGQALADTKDYASADTEFRKSLAIDPNQQETLFYDGLAMLRMGRAADAADEFRKSLNLKPGDIRTKYHLAFALIAIQKNEEASALLKEVVRQDPAYVDAYYELGKLQLDQGDAKAAIASLETGAKLGPDRDYIHYQLAMAYRRDSRISDAERELKVYKGLKDQHRGRNVAQ